MRIIIVNDCNECPHYDKHMFSCDKIDDYAYDTKELMKKCTLQETTAIVEKNACIYCEYYISNSAQCSCLHEDATKLSPDGYGIVDEYKFSRPYWCPLKQEVERE